MYEVYFDHISTGDFMAIDTEVTVPVGHNITNVRKLDDFTISIVDDKINEYNQSFLLSMSLVEEYDVCFHKLYYDECEDSSEVEIIIIDDDRKFLVNTPCDHYSVMFFFLFSVYCWVH